ncbi:M48 family metallopeptidase [Candidatus Falkowbacteria bacterium]|nr:M48 family metallopeptidase [Candidatus Falkowbacteria bacterium]MBT7348445.1 M48 family metallopeptidase [Candidatus Falkowbacteria bacterium]
MYNQIDSNKRNSMFLIVIFFAVLLGVGYAYDYIYGGQGQVPYLGMIIAVGFSLLMTSVSYFKGDKIALSASGAKEIQKTDNPYVYRMVENLCITAGLPAPKVYLIDDPSINAFATGRKPELASIAVTKGAIEKLENEELEGVIAHELSHVGNYDIRFMMLVTVLVGAIAILADWFMRISIWGGRGRSRSNKGGHPALIIIGLVFIVLSPIIAQLIKFAISRKREYLADASASLLTRYPEGLASALEKIAYENKPLARASKATAHLYIANPFSGTKVKNLFSTHPPIEERIKKLRNLA